MQVTLAAIALLLVLLCLVKAGIIKCLLRMKVEERNLTRVWKGDRNVVRLGSR